MSYRLYQILTVPWLILMSGWPIAKLLSGYALVLNDGQRASELIGFASYVGLCSQNRGALGQERGDTWLLDL
jgi:hypothetical protein